MQNSKNKDDVVMLMSGDWSAAFRKLRSHSDGEIKTLRNRYVWLKMFLPKTWIINFLLR
jgi:hypothetical protein